MKAVYLLNQKTSGFILHSAISISMSIVSSLEDDMVPLKGLQAASCKIKLAQVEKSLK